MNDFNAS